MKFLNVFTHQSVEDGPTNRMFTLLEQTLKNLAKLLSGNIGPDNILATSGFTFAHLNILNGQIGFPATEVPSAGVNTLDDYEEGTWTPTLKCVTADPTVTYGNHRAGYYTKVGRAVFCKFTIQITGCTGAGAGNLYIGGLPFTTEAGAGAYTAWTISYNTLLKTSAGCRLMLYSEVTGTQQIEVFENKDDVPSAAALTGAAIQNAVSYLMVEGFYFT